MAFISFVIYYLKMISIVAVCIDQIVDIMNGNKPGSINIAMGKINNVQYHLFVYTYRAVARN